MDEIKKESAQLVTDSLLTQSNDTPQTQTNQEYSLVSLRKMLELDVPPRKWMAYPFVQEKSICMVYAPRGLGKTYVGMTLALGIASGTNVFDFVIPEAHPVVYIDGEMAFSDFSDRMKSLCSGLKIFNSYTLDNFQILTNDLQPNLLPNLGRPDGQEKITHLLKDAEFVVIDNLSALCSYGKENEAESWTYMQKWLLQLKHDGKSVLVIDHSGKDETKNRGTSKKQDIMDAIISLSKPENYKTTDGARFIMNFQKSRNVSGDDIVGKEYKLHSDENSCLTWTSTVPVNPQDTKEQERKRARELKAQGKTTREIAEIMGIGKTKAAELAKSVPQEQNGNLDPETNLPIITLDELDESCFPH